mmetsp:Transcript_5300/g.7792  ORF Transcript_5300/g.7792 Transcript_5300/m.7792 type:complete len:131 (+) Transcript_5300:53-445(+)
MSMRYILPPYPFPSEWNRVQSLQNLTGVKIWLVPTSDFSSSISQTTFAADSDCKSKDNFESPAEINNGIESKKSIVENSNDVQKQVDEDYIENGLEMNSVWTERFSKTLKRMKVKQIKSEKRKKWSKNRK